MEITAIQIAALLIPKNSGNVIGEKDMIITAIGMVTLSAIPPTLFGIKYLADFANWQKIGKKLVKNSKNGKIWPNLTTNKKKWKNGKIRGKNWQKLMKKINTYHRSPTVARNNTMNLL